MRPALGAFLGLAVWTFLPTSPGRAEVRLDWQPHNDAGVIIDGPIARETVFELSWGQLEIAQRQGHILSYILNSPGGIVRDAVNIATEIRRDGAPVFIMSGTRCVSACFLLLAVGREKFISPDALIVIHSANTPGVGEDWDALAATALIAKLAADFGVPDKIVGRLVRTPPETVAVLNPREIAEIPGAHVLQSVPYGQFTAAAMSVDEYWAGYGAGALIAAGKSSYRSCQFEIPAFQQGCRTGMRDAPPQGWASTFFKGRRTGP